MLSITGPTALQYFFTYPVFLKFKMCFHDLFHDFFNVFAMHFSTEFQHKCIILNIMSQMLSVEAEII